LTQDPILEPEDVTKEPNHNLEKVTEIVQGEAAPEASQEESLVDEVMALRQELAETKTKEAEYLDGWQRARAELSNARKRFQRDQEQAYANARADVLTRALPIVDDFERARATLPDSLSKLTWVEGVLLIQRKLQALLDQDGVVPIQAVGEKFDPFLHQAVTHEPSDTVPEGHVIAEMQTGYRLGDRVLRPSMVRVSSGPAEVKAETASQA
jgi:molecular chaperone GrpE